MRSVLQTPEETRAELEAIGYPAPPALEQIGPTLTDEIVESAERLLRVRLPKAYLDLLQVQNGGYLHEEVEFEGVDGTLRSIEGIGFARGLDGPQGALFMREEWGYSDGLIYFDGDAHTGFCLDYRTCGPEGEPSVVWIVPNEGTAEEVIVSENFEALLQAIRYFVPREDRCE